MNKVTQVADNSKQLSKAGVLHVDYVNVDGSSDLLQDREFSVLIQKLKTSSFDNEYDVSRHIYAIARRINIVVSRMNRAKRTAYQAKAFSTGYAFCYVEAWHENNTVHYGFVDVQLKRDTDREEVKSSGNSKPTQNAE